MTFKSLLLDSIQIEWENEVHIWHFKFLNIPIFYGFRQRALNNNRRNNLAVSICSFFNDVRNDLLILIKNFDKLNKIGFVAAASYRYQNIDSIIRYSSKHGTLGKDFTLLFLTDRSVRDDILDETLIVISDRLLLIIRATAFLITLFFSPIFILTYFRFLLTVFNSRKVNGFSLYKSLTGLLISFLKIIADIIIVKVIKKCKKDIIVSGGRIPYAVTFMMDDSRSIEISHGYIGKGHLHYTSVPEKQIPLSVVHDISFTPQNRITQINKISQTVTQRRFIYDNDGIIGYFPSYNFECRDIINLFNKSQVYTFFHPRDVENSIPFPYLKMAFCEPSSIINELVSQNIPVYVVVEPNEVSLVASYFNVLNRVNFVTHEDLKDKISEYL